MGKVKNFPPYEEAKKRVIEKGIKSSQEYRTKFKELGLPSDPKITYKEEWIDWHSFLGKERIDFPPYEDAKRIVKEKGIKSSKEYRTKHKELGLPSDPKITYKEEWIDWAAFLGKEKEDHSYEDAKRIVKEKGIKSSRDYKSKYKELGLPSCPEITYKEEWIDWPSFLENKSLPYEESSKIAIENGIKSSEEYQVKYKELGLPSRPKDTYKDEWINWDDFLGRPHKTSHKERKTKVLSKLALNPILLGDKAPLQIIYMLATNMDKELASEIEILLKMMSCEERLDWVKEQLKTLKVDAPTTSDTSSETLEDEIPAMESMLEIFEDSMDDLTDEDSISIKTILENYYHNVVNKELIEEFDD